MKRYFRAIPAVLLGAAVSLSPLSAAVAPQPSAGLYTIDARTPEGLQELFAPGGDALPLVSAHRGGAGKGFPENCIATFEQTLRHCWSMLEIDPRYTKDHVLVLNHDPTLERTTSGTGRVADHTLEELKQLRLKDLRRQSHRLPDADPRRNAGMGPGQDHPRAGQQGCAHRGPGPQDRRASRRGLRHGDGVQLCGYQAVPCLEQGHHDGNHGGQPQTTGSLRQDRRSLAECHCLRRPYAAAGGRTLRPDSRQGGTLHGGQFPQHRPPSPARSSTRCASARRASRNP